MITGSSNSNNIDEEALRNLKEIEDLIPHIPDSKVDAKIKGHLFKLIDQLQDLCPKSPHASLIRKLIAQFGDAYFFYNQTGDFSFLNDFMKDAKISESAF